jgi:uncharacterized damage-inducible protein DinB
MNDVLLDAIRHNNWATRRLVTFCLDAALTNEQLTTSGIGTYGGILATLNHLVASDASYLAALLGSERTAAKDTDVAGLAMRAAETEKLWEQLLSRPIDVEHVLVVDDGANEVHAGIFLAQALNHGNHHREQVCAILTGLGIEPTDVQAWEYAWATGRLRERTAAGT